TSKVRKLLCRSAALLPVIDPLPVVVLTPVLVGSFIFTAIDIRVPVLDRYQQHGMAPLTQEQKTVAKVVNDNTPQAAKEPDYLDIP
ncbi:hypothetical protein ONO57_25580, partial [Salmonella enterica subsp. enterica serovar Anatum]|nr:hypothetical protein [Salmonella enterica subsp. enterica serovar Anatum]